MKPHVGRDRLVRLKRGVVAAIAGAGRPLSVADLVVLKSGASAPVIRRVVEELAREGQLVRSVEFRERPRWNCPGAAVDAKGSYRTTVYGLPGGHAGR